MKTRHIHSHSVEISYSIHRPDLKNSIYFIHGNSSSSYAWRKQVNDPLLNAFRLVTIDLPNHGNSEAISPQGNFSLPAIAQIIASVIHELGNGYPYITCSISLGTNIVAEMLAYEFNPLGLLFAGPCIVGKGFEMDKMLLAGADFSAVFTEYMPQEAIIKYAGETSLSTDSNDMEQFLKDYYAVKGNFRSSLYSSIVDGIYNDEVNMVHKKNIPVSIVFGENEKLVNTHYLDKAPMNLWKNVVYKIPGASHLVNIDAPTAFNRILVEFADDILQ